MRLKIRNFRSILDQEIELAPITLLYGTNGAGKSSLIYALLTLKNIALNPNRRPGDFFNFTFLDLGSFDSVVFDHQMRDHIELALLMEENRLRLQYKVSVGKDDGSFSLFVEGTDPQITLDIPVAFPYPANTNTEQQIKLGGKLLNINWNGIIAKVQVAEPDVEASAETRTLTSLMNLPVETLRRVETVPLQRGFSKPYYSAVPISPTMIVTEEEVATVLSNNKYLVSKVSHYLEKILERDFRLNFQPGTAIFSLDATDRQTGIASELVNEGFGVNQLVHFLSRALYADTEWMCVEEPEIPLHPSALRRLARAIVDITREERKRFILSTHSEPFVLAFLSLMTRRELDLSDLACYWVRKDRKTTYFERQTIHENGQIEGGLASFMEGEMEDIMDLFRSRQ